MTGLRTALLLVFSTSFLLAQKAPEIAYIFPPGGNAGTTVEVRLGGYEWTPDMQHFVLHPGVRLEISGQPGPLLMQDPPYPIGSKAYNPPPLPREVAARLIISGNVPSGPIRWQVANANGSSAAGIFIVSDGREVVEDGTREAAQQLDHLPVIVSGRLARHEEVDRYGVSLQRAGPVTCDVMAVRLGAKFHAGLEVRDPSGRLVAEEIDTAGRDCRLTFAARARTAYTISVRELDFRGHRSYVYRLSVTPSPRVVGAVPAAGRRGETRNVTFLVDTGKTELEQIEREVSFPADPRVDSLDYRLETPGGTAPAFRLMVSDLPELLEPERSGGDAAPVELVGPVAVTGVLEHRGGADRYAFVCTRDELWSVTADATRIGSPLDVVLTVRGPDGAEVAKSDDLAGSTDAALTFRAPKDGTYEVTVDDISSTSGRREALYRLTIDRPGDDFALEVPQRLTVVTGGKVELTVKAIRTGGFAGPIELGFHGLPTGITVLPGQVIPGDAAEIKVPLQSAKDAPSTAALATVIGTSRVGDVTVLRTARATAGGNSAALDPAENFVASILVNGTMKPRCRIWPVESDERTVHQGSTHLAPIGIERLQNFDGEIIVQMASTQPSKFRRGFTGPDIVLPPGVDRALYPCFMPEGLETVDAYRMTLNAVARVADSRGTIRHLVSAFQSAVSIGITIEGALLKISHDTRELTSRPGSTLTIPVTIFRSPKVNEPVRLELRTRDLNGLLSAKPVVLPPGQSTTTLEVTSVADPRLHGSHELTIRATAWVRAAHLPTITSATRNSPMERRTISRLEEGYVPVVSETIVPVKF